MLKDTLRELRTEKNMTQKELSEQLDLSKNTVCEYEKGRAEPSLETLLKLSAIFGVSVDYLLGRSDDFGNVTVTTASPSAVLTPDEQEILETYRNLPPHRRKTFMLFVESCNEESTYKNKKA